VTKEITSTEWTVAGPINMFFCINQREIETWEGLLKDDFSLILGRKAVDIYNIFR
jgi:hypothetical protein